MIAPPRICGGTAAACVRAVDDVIVDQCGAVQKLDHRGKSDGAAILAARIAGGQQKQRWAQPFSSSAQQVRGNFRNRRKSSFALSRKFLFDQDQVLPDQIKNLFGRQQSDGVSPKSVLFCKA
jgi:hypothetical protein